MFLVLSDFGCEMLGKAEICEGLVGTSQKFRRDPSLLRTSSQSTFLRRTLCS